MITKPGSRDIICGVINICDFASDVLDTVGGKMPPARLQKLCHYAQAWHLAKRGTPDFPKIAKGVTMVQYVGNFLKLFVESLQSREKISHKNWR
jgi:hypothetical protein